MADEKEILLQIKVNATELADVQQLIRQTNKEFAKGETEIEDYAEQMTALRNEEKKLKDQQKDLILQQKAQQNSIEGLRAKLALLTKERNQLNLAEKGGVDRANELNKEILKLNETIGGFERAGGDFRRNVGNYPTLFKEAAGSVSIFGQSADGLFKTLVANPFFAIIAAVTALGKALMSNDTIATALKGVWTGLGIVIDNVSAFISKIALGISDFISSGSKAGDVVKDLGNRLVNSLTAPLQFAIDGFKAVSMAMDGDFKGAAKAAAQATIDLGKSMAGLNSESNKLINSFIELSAGGVEYEKSLDDIEAKQSKLNVTIAQLEVQRARLILQSKDLSKTEEERIRLSEEAAAIDKKILNERLSLLDQEIAAQQKYTQSLGEDSVKREEAEFRLNDLLVQRSKFEEESVRFQELAQNKRNAIIEKQLAQEQKAKEERIRLEEEAIIKADEAKAKQDKINAERLERNKQAAFDLQQLKLQYEIDNTTNLEEQFLKRQELLEKQKEHELENLDLTEQERLLIIEKYREKEADLTKSYEKSKANYVKSNQDKVNDAYQKTTDNVIALLGKQSIATRSIQIADATRNTFLGATQVLADNTIQPAYLKPVVAATIIANGLATVGRLAGVFGGGGEFETNGPTMIMVGDNPGGRERVTVEPLSGRGQTRVFNNNKIAMAGGGTVIANGATSSIRQSFEARQSLLDIVSAMPAPEVSVKEITSVSKRVSVKQNIGRK